LPSTRGNPVVPFFPDGNSLPATKSDRSQDEFRPTSGQVKEAKAILKQQGLYTGKENSKLDKETKNALQAYQRARSLKPTGMLDRSTLADMGIPLTKEQERREERYTQIRPRGK
jgi:peptidoglycan hydrolase-like protein with peptidoglycan-binding domain